MYNRYIDGIYGILAQLSTNQHPHAKKVHQLNRYLLILIQDCKLLPVLIQDCKLLPVLTCYPRISFHSDRSYLFFFFK